LLRASYSGALEERHHHAKHPKGVNFSQARLGFNELAMFSWSDCLSEHFTAIFAVIDMQLDVQGLGGALGGVELLSRSRFPECGDWFVVRERLD
jgi:hypothetical protein